VFGGDQEIDGSNGEDEMNCFKLDFNECRSDGEIDCLDGSDEQKSILNENVNTNYSQCYQLVQFDCDEHFCSKDMFSCDGG
ncbi:unnamed protein product, partial [Didymodactylos carnosus]